MENQQNSIFELGLTDEGRSSFSSISQWALINAIVGFVSLGVSVVTTVMSASKLSRFNGAAAGSTFITVLITVLISLLLNITLISAANQLKKGLALSDQGYFNTGLLKLTTYFKIVGILMIIVLVIFVLVLLVVLIAGASGGLYK